MTDPVPPIPASCAQRPTIGGLAIPYINLRLADGGVDFRSPHHTKVAQCWQEALCQTCGEPTGHPAVVFGGPNQLRTAQFDEPPLCVACAIYASRACPMVAGRQTHYADRARLSETHRGATCPDPGCHCGGWTPTDPDVGDHSGDPAHPWYAVYIPPGGYAILAYHKTVRCSDRGCEHQRLIVNGAQLTTTPLKIVLVSVPGEGRVWRTLPRGEWPPIGTEVCTRA